MRVGVLALQGDFREHRRALDDIGVETVEVRTPADLAGVDGLIIPGGESSTIRLLLDQYKLLPILREEIAHGFPVLGTCAGMIVLAERVDGAALPGLEGLNVCVRRNAFGRQVDSFEEDLPVPVLGEQPFHAVFIRAPIVEEVGEGVEILARLDDGRVAAVRQGSVVGAAFHPEMTQDSRFHQYFVDIVSAGREDSSEAKPIAPEARALESARSSPDSRA